MLFLVASQPIEIEGETALALHLITCEDCGTKRLTTKRNTKYCRLCRMLRNLNFLEGRTRKCLVCENDFAPLSRNDDVCGKCNPIKSVGDPHGDCGFCGTTDTSVLDKNMLVCHACATDPEKQKGFKKSLIIKINQIRAGELNIDEELPGGRPDGE